MLFKVNALREHNRVCLIYTFTIKHRRKNNLYAQCCYTLWYFEIKFMSLLLMNRLRPKINLSSGDGLKKSLEINDYVPSWSTNELCVSDIKVCILKVYYMSFVRNTVTPNIFVEL